MTTVIVLAAHGSPPSDFPRGELMELMGRHAHADATGSFEATAARMALLEARLLSWPRNAANDPFWAATCELARLVASETGHEVLVGFNEFCAPSVSEALEDAAGRASEVIVLTPMLTRGGTHAETEIPAAIERARERHRHVRFRYAWPIPPLVIARFLAAQLAVVAADY